jgi:CPA1 family monovalent cation:H+ antiporter
VVAAAVGFGLAALAVVLAARWLSQRIAVPFTVLLTVIGGVYAVLPGPNVALRPDVVLTTVIPPLLYNAALDASLLDIRRHRRPIASLSIGLVLATAMAIGALLPLAVGGIGFAAAVALGAAVAPPDPVAALSIGRQVGLPRRLTTVIEGEGLLNDATALTIFQVAAAAATGAGFSTLFAVGDFLFAAVGGLVVGGAIAWVIGHIRPLREDALLANAVSLGTPFACYLVGEELHVSGVLAVVVNGLALSQLGPRLITAHTRVVSRAFWQLTTFLLNSTLFVLVGIQLRSALGELVSYSIADAVLIAVLVSAAVMTTRLAWMYTVPYLVAVVDRRPAYPRLGARHRLPVAWSGFRGGVSLAAALAVPVATATGARFPGRDLIVVVTFGVILATLLVQGLTLPAVLRWAKLPDDDSEHAERLLAERAAANAALAALPGTARRLAVSADVQERMRVDLEERLAALADPDDDADEGAEAGQDARRELADYRRLHAALLADKRAALVMLRDARVIDDIVLRRVQARLDAEEVRLAATVD